jgi:nicotinamidase-related amidase
MIQLNMNLRNVYIKMEANTAIYETDVQGDFVYRTGALFVSGQKPWSRKPYGAEANLPQIIALHNYAEEQGMRVLGSVDRHFYEDAELIRNEGGVFDDHCMNGTVGQLRVEELEPQKDVYISSKEGPYLGVRNYTPEEMERFIATEGHLIFEKQSYDVGTNPNFEVGFKLLMEKGLQKVIVDGFATDYCNLAAVQKMANLRDKYDADLQIAVVTDAIEAVNIDFSGNLDMEFGNKALDQMVQAGAKLVTTKDVLEGRV